MKIIVGLGNPGIKYRKTRHNIGFFVVDLLSKRYDIPIKKKGFKGIFGFGNINGMEILLLKPMTYMNLSGESVQAICSGKKIDVKKDLLIVFDDIDLILGKIRLREKGSSAGHNGIKSIIENIGQEFCRLKIGIGKEDGERRENLSTFVLNKFSKIEKEILDQKMEEIINCIEVWVNFDLNKAKNCCN